MFEKILKWKKIEEMDSDFKASTSDFDVMVTFYGIDENNEEVDETIELYVEVETHVEDFGIGSYEFWGFKGNDSQLGIEIDSIKISDPFPPELKIWEERLEERLCDAIRECDLPERDDF